MSELPYPDVAPQPSFPELEQIIQDFWVADRTFESSVEQRPAGHQGDNEYVFYDGPPFANGLPHYGHLLTGFVKDAVPRFKTMQGRRVERRFGWDCHGLPAEMETERELGISGHVEITKFGIEKFNRACQRSVLQYTEAWQRYVTRAGRWVDFKHDYKTLDITYMETVMWVFKQLWDKGLIYQGYKVLPYCWECETPLSNFETRLDDAYRNRQDQVVTIYFELDDGRRVLVWTTTPWTLPSNLALAVGPDIDYAVFEEDGHQYVLGEGTVAAYAQQLEKATRVGTVKGADLVGHTYTPLFPYFADTPGAFRVLAADFVATDEGTGVVHIAPGFGEDDQRLCDDNGIPVVVPVDQQGKFTAEVPDFAGLQVFEANTPIINALRDRGVMVKRDSYVHSYPHCWRTNTPLIYRAVGSWFVEVTKIKDRMLELNQEINWVPSHVRDGAFGSWLENARDWSISRDRFWGSPIPVWMSDDPAYPRVDVYGSIDELERDFGVRPDNLHRPFIDQLTRPNPDDPTGKSTMRRVEQVLDCWFESGSMPYAQVHYPFENAEWFEHHFPADFIVEYVGQCRAWFYNLHVLSTALFDRPAFRNCLVHGVVLGDDGRKASKSLRNYPDPNEVFDAQGSDAMRWALLSSPALRGGDLTVSSRNMSEAVRQALLPLWNAWYFFTLYANTDGRRATFRTDAGGALDRYILAKTNELVEAVTEHMEAYDLFGACADVVSYLDALTNWYIRRSRDRFYRSEADAYDTLATVLEAVCRTVAPLLPMLTETIWRGLTGERSVHLGDWPRSGELPADPDLVAGMDLVRDICSAGHSVRRTSNLRVRLPLPRVVVASERALDLEAFRDLIADELNVKEVLLTHAVDHYGERRLTVLPGVAGPRLGGDVQKVIRAVKAGEWTRADDGTVVAAGIALEEGEYDLRLVPLDDATTRSLPGDVGLVIVDTAVTPELEVEGTARDMVRLLNEARKDFRLRIADRIRVVVDCPDDVRAAVETYRDYVMAETLAVELSFHERLSEARRYELPDGRAVHIGIALAD